MIVTINANIRDVCVTAYSMTLNYKQYILYIN